MYALSVGIKGTTPSCLPADLNLLRAFIEASIPPRLCYTNFSAIVIHRSALGKTLQDSPDIFDRIICPYNADVFEFFLVEHNLLDSYLQLINNLRYSFLLGKMPALSISNIINNALYINDHVDGINTYLEEEVTARQMLGPFFKTTTEKILCGPLQSSPFVVSIQPQAPGEPKTK